MAAMQIDWSELVWDLRRSGLTPVKISKMLDGVVSERTIRFYSEGVLAPTHYRGESLLALWMRELNKVREDAPMCPVVLRSMPGARAVRA